ARPGWTLGRSLFVACSLAARAKKVSRTTRPIAPAVAVGITKTDLVALARSAVNPALAGVTATALGCRPAGREAGEGAGGQEGAGAVTGRRLLMLHGSGIGVDGVGGGGEGGGAARVGMVPMPGSVVCRVVAGVT